jgi:formylglycine-generating enzyme required for sulfatase activity/serine/threonine protein kinase
MAGDASNEPHTEAEEAFLSWQRDHPGEGTTDIDALCALHPDLDGELRELHARFEQLKKFIETAGPSVVEGLLPAEGDKELPSELVTSPSDWASHGSSAEVVERLSGHTPPRSRYEVRGRVARGGMGAILRVWDAPLQRDLAMKVVLGTEGEGFTPEHHDGMLDRFLDEAMVTGQLEHPGVLPVHELGVDPEGRVFFTMPLVQGQTLRDVFEHVFTGREGWSTTRALSLVLRVCEALAYAHSRGVLHLDVKPANVMVGRFGEVYVLDWGLAKVRGRPRDPECGADGTDGTDGTDGAGDPDSAGDGTGEQGAEAPSGAGAPGEARSVWRYDFPGHPEGGIVRGTPPYMSPEAARGDVAAVDERSDVYGLGAVLYHLLTGAPPYVAEVSGGPHPLEIIQEVRERPPRPLRELATVPAELEAICERAMAHDPADRYADVQGLAGDLRAYLEHRVVAAYETGAVAELRKWVVRNRGLASALGAVLILLVVGGGVFAWLSDELADQNVELTELNDDLDAALAEAQAQRDLANAAAEEAQAQRDLADASAAVAETERANVLRLSAFQRLEDLQREAQALWPAWPDKLDLFDDWLRRADALIAGLEPSADGSDVGHRQQLLRLRERALPPTDAQREADRRSHPSFAAWANTREAILTTEAGLASFRESLSGAEPTAEQAAQLAEVEGQLPAARELLASLDAEISRPQSHAFADGDDAWWHNQLVKLIAELEAFADPDTGLVDGLSPADGWGVRRRRDFAASVTERTLTGILADARWTEARASLADERECPQYGGLELSPQLGLLPIGRDPASGLWEFWHVASGDEPVRRPDGTLALSPDMGIVLVLLPGGQFAMGAQAFDLDGPNHDPLAEAWEGPVHEVALAPFFIGKYEVTQLQWERMTGRDPSTYHRTLYQSQWNRFGTPWSGLHPVEEVTWNDGVRAVQRMGLTLPTEAWWEFACRAGTTTPFWTGVERESLDGAANLSDDWAASHRANDVVPFEAWLDDGHLVHAPVGSYRPNAFGLHDTHGNVWEWVMDGYDEAWYGQPEASLPNPLRDPAVSIARVVRGGGFDYTAEVARSSFRFSRLPDFQMNFLGLRVAQYVRP